MLIVVVGSDMAPFFRASSCCCNRCRRFGVTLASTLLLFQCLIIEHAVPFILGGGRMRATSTRKPLQLSILDIGSPYHPRPRRRRCCQQRQNRIR